MHKVGMIAAVALVGCGPNFAGTYTGTVTAVETCSDGSGSQTLSLETVSIVDRNGTLTITVGGACDPLTATAAGNTATMEPRSCPDQSSGGFLVRQSITRGSLTLDEPDLAFSMTGVLSITDGFATITCTDTFSGTLVRQQ